MTYKKLCFYTKMAKITRTKGITKIDMGSLTIKTNAINRHRFNDLRKKDKLSWNEIHKYLRLILLGKD